MKKIILFILFLFHISAFAGVVTTTADSGVGSLRQAIIDANTGETITFDSSIDGQTITLMTSIQLTNKIITIEGNSASRMILSNSSSTEGFHFVIDGTSRLTLKNLEITSGYSYSGNSDKAGSITVSGILNIDNCLFYQNIGQTAGVIWGNNSSSQINISNSSFFDNNATNTGDGAGVIIAQGPITIKNSTFANNRGHTGVLMIGTLTSAVNKIESSTIVNNISYGSDKGVVRLNNAPVQVKNTVFYNNKNNNGAGTDNAFNGEYGGAVITSYGYNFVPSSTATFTTTTGDVYNDATNPNLIPILQNGYTVAYDLPSGSLFIDSGNCTAIDNTTILTDQIGTVRPQGSTCDKGAIEYGAILPPNITSNLIAHYNFDGNANDSSGNSYNGTYANFSSGKFGQSASFNGSQNLVINTLANHLPSGNTARTVSFWVKPNTVNTVGDMISWGNSGDATPPYNNPYRYSILHYGDATLATAAGIGGGDYVSSYSMSASTWQHITVVYNGDGNTSYYINGVFSQTTTGSSPLVTDATQPLVFGSSPLYDSHGSGPEGEFFNGLIDEVRIYNRALSASDVSALYSYTPPTITMKANGGALQFPGVAVTDNVVLPTISALNNTQHFTIETWVKISSTNPYGNIFDYKPSTNDRIVIQQLNTGHLHVIIGNSSTSNSNNQGQYPLLTNDVWHHLAVSYDGTQSTNTAKLKVYVDGVLQTATYLDAMPSTTAVYSSVSPQIGTALNGQIDEFRIWSTSRLQSEIQSTMNTQLQGNESGLAAYYNFDERTGTAVKDRTTNNNNGTITGNVQRLNFLGDTLSLSSGYSLTSSSIALQSFSASGWFKPTSGSDWTGLVASVMSSTTNQFQFVHQANGSLTLQIIGPNSSPMYINMNSTGVNVKDGNWHYLSATYDETSKTAKIYVDGVLNATGTNTAGTFAAFSSQIGIGRERAGNNPYSGGVSDVSVYNRALTQSEIQHLMASAPNVSDTSLQGYWPLNDGPNAGGGVSADGTTNTSTTNAVPAMTSNTSPSGIASASTTSGVWDPFKAFDGSALLESGWASTVITNQWLNYEFSTPKIINKYKMTTQNDNTTPKNWRIEGSNDGSNWVVLDTVSNFTTFGTSTIFSFSNSVAYKNYRIFVISNNGHGSYIIIDELAFIEAQTTVAGTTKDYSTGAHNGTITSATWANNAPTIYGNNLYSSYGINSWQKAVAQNFTPTSFVANGQTTSGNFLYTSASASDSFNISANGVSSAISVYSTQDPNVPTSGDDNITAAETNATIDGLAGIDTLILNGIKSSYTVTKNADGNFTVVGGGFTYTLINIEKLSFSDVQNISIGSLVNYPPIITSTPLTTVNPNTPYLYSLNATDVNKDLLTWSVKSGTTLPGWLSVYSGTNSVISTVAEANYPEGVVVDGVGNIYYVDYYANKIIKVDTAGNKTTFAGTGEASSSGDGGLAINAKLNGPTEIAIDTIGNLYIAETLGNRVRKVDTNGTITTVAGTGTSGTSGDGGLAINAQFDWPMGIAVDKIGNLYITEKYNDKVRKIDVNGTITAIASGINMSMALAVDDVGNLYIAQSGNNTIKKLDINGTMTTIAGNGTSGFSGDGGVATNAQLNNPTGVVVDKSGKVYIADYQNNRIRKVDTNGTITTVAGNGSDGFNGDGGVATNATLHWPSSVAITSNGDMFIADRLNSKIRKVSAFTIKGTTPSTLGNHNVSLSVTDGLSVAEQSFQISLGIVGNAGDNNLTGTSGNNYFQGTSGNDTLNGLDGNDTVVYDENKSSYIVTKSGSTYTITKPDGIDILTSIEFLSFSDVQNVAIDSLVRELTLKAHGGAVQFDGSGGYIKTNNVVTTQTDNITMEAWVNWGGSTGANQYILTNGTGLTNGYGVMVNTSNELRVALSNTTVLNPNVTLTPNEWHHIALTRENGVWQFYYDGVIKSMTNATYTDISPTGEFAIGANTFGANKFKGMIDEVRVWNIAKTNTQIQTNMNQQLDGNETGLVAYYNFDEKVGNKVVDIAGFNNNGTIEGNVTRLNFLGEGLDFNATSQIATNASFSTDGNLTFSAWIKPTAIGSGSKVILHQSGSFAIELYDGRFGASSVHTTNGMLLPLNQWSHISTTMKFLGAGSTLYTYYVNGAEVASFSAWQGANTDSVYIGTTDSSFSGQLAEVTAWNKVLSQNEIKKLTVSSSNLNDSSLLAYFPLNEGSEYLVKDYVSNESSEIFNASWVKTAPTIYGNTIYTATGINSIIKPVLLNSSNESFGIESMLSSVSLFNDEFPILNRADGIDGEFDLNTTDNGQSFIQTVNLKHLGIFTTTALADGNNTISGTMDIDTIIYDGNRSQYSIVKHIEGGYSAPQTITFTLTKPNGDIDTLDGAIEYISFNDFQNISLANLDSWVTTVTKTNFPYKQIAYTTDGTKLFGSSESGYYNVIHEMNTTDKNVTATYSYTQEHETIKDMIVVGNYLLVSSVDTNYSSSSATMKINTFNVNNIASGPVATWSQTFSSGGQIEGKMAYANGKLALIGGYSKSSFWMINATNLTNLSLVGEHNITGTYRYPTNVTISKDGTSLAVASYYDVYLYSINADANATYASTISNLSDGRGVYPTIANGKLIVFLELYNATTLFNMKTYNISNLASPTLINTGATYTGTMVNTTVSADEKWLFMAYRDDSNGQDSNQKLLTYNLTSGIPVLVDSKSDSLNGSFVSDIALSPVGQKIATTGDNLWIYNNSLYVVSNQVPTINNDFIHALETNATIDGLGGVDTVILNGTKGSYTITKNTISNFTVVGNGYIYTLNNIEIVSFSDGQNILLSSMNNAPILTTIPNPNGQNEDFSDFNITLSSTDTENDSVRYSAKSNDTSKATVTINGNILTVHSVANAIGTASIDVNVSQENNSSLYDMQTITFTINSVNDAPVILSKSSFTTQFDEATLNPNIHLDVPDASYGNVTLDTLNQVLHLSASQSTDMYGSRNNAPIAWVSNPNVAIGKKWNVETQVTVLDTASQGQVAGITLYSNTDGSVPIFTYGLDAWGGTLLHLQQLPGGSEISDTSISMTGKNSVFLKVEVTEGGTTDNYSFYYKFNSTDSWTLLSTDSSSYSNARIGLFYKTNGIKAGVDFDYLSITADINQTITEDSGTINYKLDVSDIEGDDLNLTVESNNTSIVTVTPSWNGLVNQANYSNLDFNITTVPNANGLVKITITVNDGDKNSTRTLDINVTAVNDAPILSQLNDINISEDFSDLNITLSATDVDGDSISYEATSSNTSRATVSIVNGKLVIVPVANTNGIVTITVNATANGQTATRQFTLNITPLNDAPLLEITTSKVSALTYETVTLSAIGTDLDNNTLTYLWNFGDGSTRTEQNATKFYSSVGTYEVSCTVSDGQGGVNTKDLNITVSAITSFSIDKEKMTLSISGGSQQLTVTKSNLSTNFTVTNNDSSIITATIDGNYIIITPHKIGKTFITINDGTASKIVKITVSSLDRNSTTGIATDTITALQWQDTVDVKTNNATFTGAQTYCSNLTLGSYDDWRVASVDEMLTLVDYDNYDNVFSPILENSISSNYWSGTEYLSNSNQSWVVSGLSGNIGAAAKTVTNPVRCVRGGEFKTFSTLSGLKNAGFDRNATKNIVTDSKNNLQWQDNSAVGTVKQTSQGAKSYCEGLTLDGNGWRLPSVYELATITHFTDTKNIFVNTSASYLWSGTKLSGYENYVWYIDQNNGNINYNNSATLNSVRCVRGGDVNATYSSLLYKNTPVIANGTPVLSITKSRATATINESINFTATVADTNHTISYSWTFGDGTTSSVQNPTKTYANTGTYNVSCVIIFGDYNISQSFDITIVNNPIEYKYLSFNVGWSLVSLPISVELNATQIGERFATATSIWKYSNNNWQVYPQVSNIAPIATIKDGEGFWVSAINSNKLQFEGTRYTVLTSSALPTTLANGWYLLGTGTSATPAALLQRNSKIYSIWKYTNNKWEAYSNDTTLAQKLLDNHIETIETINGSEGFWINIKN